MTNYLWDEFSRFGNILLDYDADGIQTAYTISNGAVLSQRQNGLTNYNLTDALGSVRIVSDATGQTLEMLDYSAFGEPFFTDSVSTYQFTGERYDNVTGLLYLRARDYAPSLGRMLSRDTHPVDFNNPIELNRYVYVANNPMRYVDPSGLNFVERMVLDFQSMSREKQIATVGIGAAGLYFYTTANIMCAVNNCADDFNKFLDQLRRLAEDLALDDLVSIREISLVLKKVV